MAFSTVTEMSGSVDRGDGRITISSVFEMDLSSSGAPPRNWRGIGLAMVVISVVLSLVLLSIFLLSPENEKLPEKSSLTLSDLESMEYQVYIPHLYWTSHSEIIMECRERNLIKLNVETKKSSTLLSNITLMSLKASSAEVSSDLQNVLMLLDMQQVSVFCQNYCFNILATI
ncbi:inactive dipeptidyl peptidase 10-like [Spea bombifrons]|uniref:inactive dipeptidyl peptidase 10-like n=1 Tax=Spea bombifrons TaxID=233779 RepID=UPI0023498724|nr:inactive dipeptidyl peptidase 10-like [Spea bombifrons]